MTNSDCVDYIERAPEVLPFSVVLIHHDEFLIQVDYINEHQSLTPFLCGIDYHVEFLIVLTTSNEHQRSLLFSVVLTIMSNSDCVDYIERAIVRSHSFSV
ncbi:hypothetical protein AVEN_148785-1 [Araneus ventricosus]|uniref:Uncharacterized protein n=1 Tax=Araneus ventricosus TaxID=182803 RepID=A0A4Y2TQ44_ARAVE|nr:hypothetical protein AVEN_148785-1 [Araneus ventricosus]